MAPADAMDLKFQFVHSGNMQKVTLDMAQSVSTVWLYNSQ